MATLSADKTKKSLLKKGFKQFEGDHHHFLYYHNGVVVAKTKLSHNNQDIGNNLISKMHKQCQITKDQFFDLINCPLAEADYIEILKQKGTI